MSQYRVVVITGTPPSAGTDADVWITLFSTDGSNSGERFLDNAADNFENGHTDTFTFDARDFDELKGVFIRHNNSGNKPGWFLDRVIVFNDERGKVWTFPCNRWLALDEDDGQIARFLFVA